MDGAVAADPFAGVWRGDQGNETWTLTNSAGCATWVGVVSGTVCAFCAGTYSATTGASTVTCQQRNGCANSSNHTDVGTLTISGCSITYNYNFGSGTSTWSGMRISDATGDVCSQADGSTQ